MLQHSFSVEVAKSCGVNAAVLFTNISFWVEHNKANRVNEHDGKYWTFNSMQAFTELFPYLSKRQIETALKKLESNGLIETGSYNKLPFDRTKWYTITAKGYRISQKCEIDLTSKRNDISQKCDTSNAKCEMSFHQNVTPIPDINTDINADTVDTSLVNIVGQPTQASGGGLAKVIQFYQDNFGMLSSYLYGDIRQTYDDWKQKSEEPAKIMIKAMKIALEKNARNWRFVAKVLMNWENSNPRTLADVEALEKEHGRRGQRRKTSAEQAEEDRKFNETYGYFVDESPEQTTTVSNAGTDEDRLQFD